MDASTTELFKEIDDETTLIATRIQKLIDQAAAQGQLSTAEINAALLPEVARLKGIAADPAVPVPPAPPTPPVVTP